MISLGGLNGAEQAGVCQKHDAVGARRGSNKNDGGVSLTVAGGHASRHVPLDEILCLPAQVDIIGELEVMLPLQDLVVRLVRRLGAEGRVADKTLEHDGAKRPPVTLVAVSLLHEDFRGNVVRRADGGVCLEHRECDERYAGEVMNAGFPHQFPTVRFPCRDLVLA